MGIRVEYGKPSTLLTAAQIKGEERATQQQLERTERLQAQQREFEYRTAIRQQDLTIDLQMQERAKLWEIQKMELRSQVDFQREEQQRQRKLDGYDNVDAELDKQIQAGQMNEEEAKSFRIKNDLARQGMNVSISDIRRLQEEEKEEERYGVQPYWMRGQEAQEGTPGRQLYEAKMAEGISGQRTGTVPWDLNPQYIRTAAAEESRVNRGIFLEPEDIDEFLRTGAAQLPLADKQLDVGVQADVQGGTRGGVQEGEVPVISPTGEQGTIPFEDLEEALAEGYTRVTEEPLPKPQITREQAEKRYKKYKYPSLKRFFTQSPLKTAVEIYGMRNK